eukprot:UN33707
MGKASAKFFDPKNKEGQKARQACALASLEDLYKFMIKDSGEIAILDGTNSTLARRKLIREFFTKKKETDMFKIMFVESLCTDESIVENNILSCKLSNPDYKFVDPEKAVSDFRERIKLYQSVYTPVKDDEGSYVKIINAGRQVVGHEVQGYLPGRIMYFLMHLNLHKKAIFLTRHGESQYNVEGRIGGDAPLSKEGKKYAKKLTEFISLQHESENLKIYCSTLKRTIETCKYFQEKQHVAGGRERLIPVMKWRALSEIEVGCMDGLTIEEFKTQFPQEYNLRNRNKLTYRYPQGESYRDIIQRLEPIIFEL